MTSGPRSGNDDGRRLRRPHLILIERRVLTEPIVVETEPAGRRPRSAFRTASRRRPSSSRDGWGYNPRIVLEYVPKSHFLARASSQIEP